MNQQQSFLNKSLKTINSDNNNENNSNENLNETVLENNSNNTNYFNSANVVQPMGSTTSPAPNFANIYIHSSLNYLILKNHLMH